MVLSGLFSISLLWTIHELTSRPQTHRWGGRVQKRAGNSRMPRQNPNAVVLSGMWGTRAIWEIIGISGNLRWRFRRLNYARVVALPEGRPGTAIAALLW